MRIVSILLFLSLFASKQPLLAQNNYDYGSEYIWGVNKNTSGGLIGGFILRKEIKVSDRLYQSFGVEIMNIKHRKERRENSNNGNFFIFGKLNYLYAIRTQYGREYILFRKGSQQGVEVKVNLAAGPSLGFLNPYYVEIFVDNGTGWGFTTYKIPYTADIPFSRIMGPGNLLQGMGEAQLKLGGNLKASLSFELGSIKSNVTGFELGFLIDSYLGELPLMINTENKSVFPTAFFTLFYGLRK
ncbi:MAG: hypothetical protein OEY34_10465 [Cyclobacteriaceae bacterium]|nr:hypothetical protein [Cyclobacteriaceae bacterium]